MISIQTWARIPLVTLMAFTLVHCASKPPSEPAPQITDTPLEPGVLSVAQQATFRNGIAEIGKENYKRAIKLLQPLSKQGTFDQVSANLALAYYKSDDMDAATDAVSKALSINPNNARAHNLAGLIAMQQGHFPSAETSFIEAIRLDSEYALAHYNLALLYDTYYQEISKAYNHYLRYLALIDYADQETVTWVEQLKYAVEQEENTQ